MSSVLHPVGPEPRERYWVRRLAVVVAAIAAIAIVVALVGNALSAGSAVQAEPALPTYVPVPVTASPTPTPSASASPSPAPGATPSAKASANPKASPKASSSATPSAKADSTKTDSKTNGSKKKAESTRPAEQKKAPVPATPATCEVSSLHPAVAGDRTVRTTKKTTFALSLVNRGEKTCTVTANPASVALTVVSGGDRIWSTRDCPAAQPTVRRTIRPGHAAEWQVTWSGKRSGDGCSTGAAAPRAGYYWAIAELEGGREARFRVILT